MLRRLLCGVRLCEFVGVDSGEGVLVRADSKGAIKVVGLTPKLGR